MLTESELDEIEAMLAAIDGEDAPLPIDGLHGFFSALCLIGAPPPTRQWLPWVLFPTGTPPGDLDSLPRLAAITARLERFLAHTGDEIVNGDECFAPLVRSYPCADGEYADAAVWCAGFVHGISRVRAQWAAFLQTPGVATLLEPIFSLAGASTETRLTLPDERRPRVSTRTLNDVQRSALTEELPYTLDALAEAILVWETDQAMMDIHKGSQPPPWAGSEPCPCGSGAFFLDCCGGERVLH